jgi:hypothetical protein
LEGVKMDLVQSKLNVIEWLTDYRGHFTDRGDAKIVELKSKKGWLSIWISAPNVASLLKRLDKFLFSKVKI